MRARDRDGRPTPEVRRPPPKKIDDVKLARTVPAFGRKAAPGRLLWNRDPQQPRTVQGGRALVASKTSQAWLAASAFEPAGSESSSGVDVGAVATKEERWRKLGPDRPDARWPVKAVAPGGDVRRKDVPTDRETGWLRLTTIGL